MDEVQSVFDVHPSLFFVLLLPVCWPLSRGSRVEHVPVTWCDLSCLVLLPVWASPPLPEHTTLSAWKRCASCSTVSSLLLCATATYWPRLYCSVICFFLLLLCLTVPEVCIKALLRMISVFQKGLSSFMIADFFSTVTFLTPSLFSCPNSIYICISIVSFLCLWKGFYRHVTMTMWGVTMQRQSRHLQHLADTLVQRELQ